jgi:hypothetical protein
MRTITKTHQAPGESMILNPSVRIEPVRTDSRDRGIDVDSSNVYREQRAGRYSFRTSIVVQKQVLFGAPIKQAYDRFKSNHLLKDCDPSISSPFRNRIRRSMRSKRCQAATTISSRVVATPAAP